MMRSMNSAVSALRNYQIKMDVIGNNIANVGTVGYKGSRATFKETFSQTMRGGGGPMGSQGGTNPQQVGLGMALNSIDTVFNPGSADVTGRGMDAMIEGEGFFMVSKDGSAEGALYTRAGVFGPDAAGNIVTPDGMKLIGYQADKDGVVGTQLGGIVVNMAETVPPQVTDKASLLGNLNSKTDALDKIKAANPEMGEPIIEKEITNSAGKKIKVFEVNPKAKGAVGRDMTVDVYDSLGGKHAVRMVFVKASASPAETNWTVYTYAIGKDGSQTAGEGSPLTGVFKFGPDGRLIGDPKMSLNLTELEGAQPIKIDAIDLSGMTQYEAESSLIGAANGNSAGKLTGFTIAKSGEVEANFSNGMKRVKGQIATAIFSNPGGLIREGNSLFSTSQNSGQAQVNRPGAGGNGSLNAGALEMSGVDLGAEFTSMIVTQRGFQANSRVITTTDQMLEELVNLKR